MKRSAVALLLPVLAGRLLLLPADGLQRESEARAAYREYRSCLRVEILCSPRVRCSGPDCFGNYLRQIDAINRKYRLLSTFDARSLLSGWQPRPRF